jgi:hypothetical protein
LGTLTHADTATSLWREGLQAYLLCTDASSKAEALQRALAKHRGEQERHMRLPAPQAVEGAAEVVSDAGQDAEQDAAAQVVEEEVEEEWDEVKATEPQQKQQQQQQQQEVHKLLEQEPEYEQKQAQEQTHEQQQMQQQVSAAEPKQPTTIQNIQKLVDPVEMLTEPERRLFDDGMPDDSDEDRSDKQHAAFSDQDWDDALPPAGDAEIDADEPSDLTWREARTSKRDHLLDLLKEKVEQYGLSKRQQLRLAGLVRKEQRQRHRASLASGWDQGWEAGADGDGADDGVDDVDADEVDEDNGDSKGRGGRHGRRHGRKHDHNKHEKHEKHDKRHGAPDYDGYGDPESYDTEGHSRRHKDHHGRESRHEPRAEHKVDHEEHKNALYQHRAARKFAHEGHKQVSQLVKQDLG